MQFPQKHTLKQIATILDIEYVGEDDFPIYGMNEIHVVQNGDIVFVDHPKYYDKALNSAATVILINKKVEKPEGKALLISEDPFTDFNKLTTYFKPFEKADKAIASSAEIGENTHLQPNVFIGNNVKIGKNCRIHSNVSIYDNSIIGDNVIIHANTVIGADAFYYKNRPSEFDKLKSGGRVVIENDVELGAACTIDKGVSGDTTIKAGTKIDNQVQVGHDTVIGEKCLIASQTGIAGCVVIENEVTIWGQVGIRSDVVIGKKAIILAQSGISKNLVGDTTYYGSPAQEARKMFKEAAMLKRIPALLKKHNIV
ncbi:UDP-3-O-(3-hydroxymyristoyl)glucosamine N-acyltransferase [Haloflavibacter putidus]|uniref:UDP-3-O-(3-hydroxymyristoyl)glucosamine N-acyltransferase n=1 Tax=Haloflavibacter putidus TaxID=2576776 RepID=A0A507ZRB5_9FLAO|nr:UDP-3-O-(3-hydroxymyristoyl)glucosamine N-acyltransferase [Haloflavibacter putidus]TQD39063.1 UDP-3-O-(3-hydroxymyristoyl)glucosamine N-acyltransferase [Haloflavibacter putidus]